MHYRRAVTLVEVLVVIAVLSTLLGVLLPALGMVRESSRDAACAATQDGLFTSMSAWAAEHRNRIPGVNTTGARMFRDPFAQEDALYESFSTTPTSIFDWMSPVLGDAADLSSNRAERTRQLFTDHACPAARNTNDALWGWAPDMHQFEKILEEGGYPQISYLSPASFHLLGPPNGAPHGMHYGWSGPAVTPVGYRPRLEEIGRLPSTKIFVADGTRYVGGEGQLDFDVDPAPEYFGSFTSSGPIYVASTAYGVARHLAPFAERPGAAPIAPGAPRHNRDLSYRHRGRMGALRFDGSFGWMTVDESKSDAAPWYPSGSLFTGAYATPLASEHHEDGEYLW